MICRTLVYGLISVIGLANAYGQSVGLDSLVERLMYQVWSFPQEKVYVVTDKDAYVAGDSIRCRAFLVDAVSHRKPEYGSRFVYVELVDPFGDVRQRVKLRSSEGTFAGIVPVGEEIAEGTYTMRAYTQFMQNSSNDYFFKKTLPIFSNMSQKYRIATDFENGKLTSRLTERESGKPVRAENIVISDAHGKPYHPEHST